MKLEKFLESEGIRVRYKDSSRFMWLLGKILFFNPRFMTGYITTIHRTVYFPTKDFAKDDYRVWSIMAHEAVHAADSKKWTFLAFSCAYLFPQILAVVALGALGAFWDLQWLWCLAALAFLAPIPAYGRMKLEMRGYAMSMAAHNWSCQVQNSYSNGSTASNLKKKQMRAKVPNLYSDPPDYIVEQFTGGSYYWMWPFKKDIRTRLHKWLDHIAYEQIEQHIPIAQVVRSIIFEELKEK